nr:protein regulator of cytokinesis 1-like isoform X1 [Procambarus clarkii]
MSELFSKDCFSPSYTEGSIMEEFENEIIDELRHISAELKEIWNEIGFDAKNCSVRQNRTRELVTNLLKDVLDGETSLRNQLAKSIEDNGKEFYHLNKELGICLPDPDDTLKLYDLERCLRHKVAELRTEVNKRRDTLRDLRDKEKELCDRLSEEPCIIPKKPIPSKEDMEEVERRIRTLEQEKTNREKTFKRLKRNLSSLLEQLELKPSYPFEHSILSDIEGLFILSCENLQKLKQLNEDYDQKVKENECACLQLHEQIRLLYDRLEVDPVERDNFFASINSPTPSVLTTLQRELERLEELKRQNMSRFINQLRRELEILWEKCHICERERNSFLPYFTEGYTEEILEAHDNEVMRLNAYFNDHKQIFMKIKQRHEVWNKLVQLEEKANDPNRLFGNRGCSLLQEEKERKRVKNELPRVEKELEELVLASEAKHGKPFLIDDKTISDYITDQWHKYNEQKAQEKKVRQNNRVKQLNSESRLGPNSTKRRLARNDSMRNSKLRRIGEEHSMAHSSIATPVRGPKSVLREHDQNTMKNVTTRLFTKKEGSNLSSVEVSSYSNFSDGIQRRSERENIRSSVVHGHKKTPLVKRRVSPRYPPPGLPKTPMTLPRISTRRSPRVHGNRRSPRNSTVTRTITTPSSSRAPRSPYAGPSRLGTPSRWSKLSFLI